MNTAQELNAREAKRLRNARNTIRHFERRKAVLTGKKLAIEQRRFERACALVAKWRLEGRQPRRPISIISFGLDPASAWNKTPAFLKKDPTPTDVPF